MLRPSARFDSAAEPGLRRQCPRASRVRSDEYGHDKEVGLEMFGHRVFFGVGHDGIAVRDDDAFTFPDDVGIRRLNRQFRATASTEESQLPLAMTTGICAFH